MAPVTIDLRRIRDVLGNLEHVMVSARCHSCPRVVEVDWLSMAIGYGEDTALSALARRMKCKCGARGCGWQVVPRTREYGR